MAQDFVKLLLPNDLSYLDMAQSVVRQAAGKYGFDKTATGQIELAVEEAVTNVIKHAYEAGEQSKFEIICERIPLGIKVVIKDWGLPFDPALVPAYNSAAALKDNIPGLGVLLMKNAVDMVSFVNLGSEGKETHLVKYLPQQNIEQKLAGQKLETDKTPPVQVVADKKIPYDVRRMRPEEAIEVSKCAYKSHGYSFFDDTIYFPDRIVALNNSEELISLVAVTKDNIFMGHTALHYPCPGAPIAELTFAFVNMEYRGQGCLNRLTDLLFTCEKKFPLAGIYINAVTNHLITQKVAVKYGVNDCGIYLAASPGTWIFKGISGESKQRLSVVLSFKYLQPPRTLTLYPPQGHAAMIEKLYRNIGAAHTCRVPDASQTAIADEKSSLRTDVYASENCAEIWATSLGSDIVRQVKNTLRDLCVKNIAATYLYLDMANPATYFIVPELEKLGFFFSGILPETFMGDTIILQYLNNMVLDYSQVQLLTPVAKELMAYIKERDPNLVTA